MEQFSEIPSSRELLAEADQVLSYFRERHVEPGTSVHMAIGAIVEEISRGHEPGDIARRAAIVLLTDPEDDITMMRCPRCGKAYVILHFMYWPLVGREDGICFRCSNPPPRLAITSGKEGKNGQA